MAATAGIIGAGVTLGYSATSGGSYTSVAEILEITPPNPTAEKIDFSHAESPGLVKEYKAGFIEAGECALTINFNKTQYNTLDGLRGTAKYWKITLSDLSTIIFPGFIMSLTPPIDVKGKVTAKVSICATGSNTFAAGA